MALSPTSSNASTASSMEHLMRALSYADERVAAEQDLGLAQMSGYFTDVRRLLDTLVVQNCELRARQTALDGRHRESEEASRGEIAALKDEVCNLEKMLVARQSEALIEAHRIKAIREEVMQLREMATAARAQAKVAETKTDVAVAATGAVQAELNVSQALIDTVRAELSAVQAATETKTDAAEAATGAMRAELTVLQATLQTSTQENTAKFVAIDAVIAQHEAPVGRIRATLAANDAMRRRGI